MAERPRSNDSRKLHGVKQKKKSAKSEATAKTKIGSAKERLRGEILKGTPEDLHSAFDAFGEGCDLEILTKMVGIEFVRLQRSLGPGEAPDFRYWAAMNKIVDQLRRLITIREGSESFIPDSVSMTLAGTPTKQSQSDVPEYS